MSGVEEAHSEIVIAGLLATVAALVTLARVLHVPYPIFLVLGGLAIGFFPGLPEVSLEPDLVLLIFLPPLLYSAAFFASLRDLRANAGSISLLSIGLVLATCLAVAVVAHEVDPRLLVGGGVPARRDRLPHRPRRGHGDRRPDRAAAPGRHRRGGRGADQRRAPRSRPIASPSAAVLTGSFSALDAGGKFVLGAVGGVAIGLAVGWVVAQVRERLDDPPVEVTISLFTGYAAYLPAEELELSGVIAAVTVGLYMGSQTARVTTAQTRMQGFAMWQILVFLLNSFLFVLIGLQLPDLLDALREADFALGTVVGYGLLASLAVVLVRIVWVFAFSALPLRGGQRWPRGQVALVAWMGMRGAVSLAAALAIPFATDAGQPIAERPLILFITFSVILFTLVVQGLTLPLLVRVLHVEPDDDGAEFEENKARKLAARAALDRLDALGTEDWTRDDTVERMRGMYRYRYERFAARFDDERDGDAIEGRTADYLRIVSSVIEAQREQLEELRRSGAISSDVMRRIERELDLEEGRFLG